MTTCLNFLNVGESLAKTFDARTHPAILHNAVQLSLPDDIKLPRHPPCQCRKTQNSGHRNMRQETRPFMEHTYHQNPPCMKNLNHLVEMEHLACLGDVTAWPQGTLDRTHRGDIRQ